MICVFPQTAAILSRKREGEFTGTCCLPPCRLCRPFFPVTFPVRASPLGGRKEPAIPLNFPLTSFPDFNFPLGSLSSRREAELFMHYGLVPPFRIPPSFSFPTPRGAIAICSFRALRQPFFCLERNVASPSHAYATLTTPSLPAFSLSPPLRSGLFFRGTSR